VKDKFVPPILTFFANKINLCWMQNWNAGFGKEGLLSKRGPSCQRFNKLQKFFLHPNLKGISVNSFLFSLKEGCLQYLPTIHFSREMCRSKVWPGQGDQITVGSLYKNTEIAHILGLLFPRLRFCQ
jgi:hypothetical protein